MKAILFSLFIISFFITSCKSVKSLTEDYVLNSERCLEYKRAPSMADPSGIHVLFNENGELIIKVNRNDNSESEYLTRLPKDEALALWSKIDSIQGDEWNKTYEIGLDSKVYRLSIYENGSKINHTKYSTGAPKSMKLVVAEFEKLKSDYEGEAN